MIYELVNPSDAVTFEGDNDLVAALAALLLGEGHYALTNENGENVLPIFMFGGHEKWLAEKGISDLGEALTEHSLAMADFLETCFYGDATKRIDFNEAIARMTPEVAMEYRASTNDRHRSSMNNIGKRCLALAKRLRETRETTVP